MHTTELELTPRAETADYGNLAVYRKDDLDRLAERVREPRVRDRDELVRVNGDSGRPLGLAPAVSRTTTRLI